MAPLVDTWDADDASRLWVTVSWFHAIDGESSGRFSI